MLSTEKTLSEVIEILRQRGYTEDFNLLEENISYKKEAKRLIWTTSLLIKYIVLPDKTIWKTKPFYMQWETERRSKKGVFVNGYGTYTDSGANAVISKINVEENDNDDWTIEKWFLLTLHREIFIFHISYLCFVADSSTKFIEDKCFQEKQLNNPKTTKIKIVAIVVRLYELPYLFRIYFPDSKLLFKLCPYLFR